MADTVDLRQETTVPGDAPTHQLWTSRRTARRASRRHTGIGGVAAVATICAAGFVLTTSELDLDSDDGAGVVPAIALVAITIAVARWHPDPTSAPVRNVSPRFAVAGAIGGVVDAVAIVLGGDDRLLVVGPAITLALATTYLSAWGFRSLALLRTVVLFSILAWAPVATVAHRMVRTSLDQPSAVVYRRLAQLEVFGVTEEPWRLFTAELHRGALVVIATLLFGIGASRWRVSLTMAVDLLLAISAALIAHHVIVLASAIDDYDPARPTQLATNPALEVAIAAGAVVALTAARARRQTSTGGSAAPAHTTDERDPVIFSNVQPSVPPTVRACLAAGALPLVALVALR